MNVPLHSRKLSNCEILLHFAYLIVIVVYLTKSNIRIISIMSTILSQKYENKIFPI
jgi:hypothetical protein